MSLTLDDILMLDDWTEADRLAVRNAIQADPSLGQALHRWIRLSGEIGGKLESNLPAREALVLLACRDRFDATELSQDEQRLMADASARLEGLLTEHPSVSTILDRIRDEARAFDSAWASTMSVHQHESDRGPLRKTSGHLRLVRRALAAAAVIVVLVLGRQWVTDPVDAPVQSWVATASWQSVDLPDGSTVRLGPESSLEWMSGQEAPERRLRFDGQAWFDVASSPRPFILETDHAVTTVLGTSFTVRTGTGTEVTLVSGRVSLAGAGDANGSVILEPGEQGLFTTGMQTPSVRTVDPTTELAWTELLIFRDTIMEDVVKRLSEAFGVTITLDESLKQTPLTGTFESERGTRSILDVIAAALGASVSETDDGAFHIAPVERG